MIYYADLTYQLSVTAWCPKSGLLHREQVLNPRHQTKHRKEYYVVYMKLVDSVGF